MWHAEPNGRFPQGISPPNLFVKQEVPSMAAFLSGTETHAHPQDLKFLEVNSDHQTCQFGQWRKDQAVPSTTDFLSPNASTLCLLHYLLIIHPLVVLFSAEQ